MKLRTIIAGLALFAVASILVAGDSPSTSAGKKAGASQFIFVMGEVLAQGRFPWTNGFTLTHSIERAGGFSTTADRTKVQVRSSGSVTQVCNYTVAASDPAKDLKLSPGDVVFVPRSELRDAASGAAARLGIKGNLPPPEWAERFIVIEGAVRRPGQFVWSNEMRLSIAVDAAGGLTASADASRVRIRHQNGGVDTANYSDATNSPAKNNILLRGDRITVPRKDGDK
jgi:protein involved in polysaccharide export with SLBB domain